MAEPPTNTTLKAVPGTREIRLSAPTGASLLGEMRQMSELSTAVAAVDAVIAAAQNEAGRCHALLDATRRLHQEHMAAIIQDAGMEQRDFGRYEIKMEGDHAILRAKE